MLSAGLANGCVCVLTTWMGSNALWPYKKEGVSSLAEACLPLKHRTVRGGEVPPLSQKCLPIQMQIPVEIKLVSACRSCAITRLGFSSDSGSVRIVGIKKV